MATHPKLGSLVREVFNERHRRAHARVLHWVERPVQPVLRIAVCSKQGRPCRRERAAGAVDDAPGVAARRRVPRQQWRMVG
jgi:hypothetical protein